MNNTRISIMLWLLVSSILLVCCNLPVETDPTEQLEGLVYTAAAQTIVAQYTQSAETIEPIVEPTISPNPTATDTSTLTLTATGTPTPTETITPTDIPNIIFEDDFTSTSLWYIDKEDNYGFEYKDGGYRIYNQILNGAIWSIRYQRYKDIRVEVDATRLDGPLDGYYGVVCRLSNDGMDYYALVIGSNGFYGIMKMEEGEQEFLAIGQDDREVLNQDNGDSNRIQGICVGDKLELLVNGHQILEVVDESLEDGDVGLVVGNQLGGIGMDVLFDNFALVWP